MIRATHAARWVPCTAVGLIAAFASPCLAQFTAPAATNVREKIVGKVIASDGAPTPEAGDQIAGFIGTTVCGLFVYTSSAADFSITIYGDVSGTAAKEGPVVGDKVTFKFYDSSANATLPMTVLNTNNEVFNYTYNGQTVIDLPGGIPIDITPTVSLNMRIGTGSGGTGNGTGGGSQVNKYDINADGKVSIEDAAMILAAITGGSPVAPSSLGTASAAQANQLAAGNGSTAATTPTTDATGATTTPTASGSSTTATPASMDVNGDGVVDINDAIEVLRHKGTK